MSFPRQTRRNAGLLIAISAAVATGLAYPANATADDALSGVSGLTSIVSSLPVGNALPSNLLSKPDSATPVVMEQNGATKELPAQVLEVWQGHKKMTALRLAPQEGPIPGDLPVTTSLPLVEELPVPSLSDKGGPNDPLAKINWILQQTATGGLPVGGLNPAQQGTSPAQQGTGALGGPPSSPAGPATATDQEKMAATQAAVWHYSTGANLVPQRNSAAVTKLYRYFTGPANNGLPVKPAGLSLMDLPTAPSLPTADLPAPLKDLAGQLIGPFTLSDTMNQAMVEASNAPQGAQLLDETGKPAKVMKSKTRYFFHVPAGQDPGQTVLSAISDPQAAVGRVLSTANADSLSDGLVLTGGDAIPRRQSAAITWGTDTLVSQAGISPVCTKDGIGVNINNSKRTTPLNLAVDGKEVMVPKGATKVVPVPVAEGDAYDILVAEGSRAAHLTGTRYCDQTKQLAHQRKAETGPQADVKSEGRTGGGLPMTGTAIAGVLVTGFALLGGGAVLYVMARRRRVTS